MEKVVEFPVSPIVSPKQWFLFCTVLSPLLKKGSDIELLDVRKPNEKTILWQTMFSFTVAGLTSTASSSFGWVLFFAFEAPPVRASAMALSCCTSKDGKAPATRGPVPVVSDSQNSVPRFFSSTLIDMLSFVASSRVNSFLIVGK